MTALKTDAHSAHRVFCYIWEYIVAPQHLDAFVAAYGARGAWVALFTRDPAYLGTELHRDSRNPRRFMTIDYWKSRSDFASFTARMADEFTHIDDVCGQYTERERHVGDFEVASSSPLSSGFSTSGGVIRG